MLRLRMHISLAELEGDPPMNAAMSKPRLSPLIPYALGLFMLVPYVLWAVLWLFVFPGDKNGFDSELSTVLFAASAPLVIWFFLCALGFIANSMGGDDEFEGPRAAGMTTLIALLPSAAVILGLAGGLWLLSLGEPASIVAAPPALGMVIAFAIAMGERARTGEARSKRSRSERGLAIATGARQPVVLQRALFWGCYTLLAGALATLIWGVGAVVPTLALLSLIAFVCLIRRLVRHDPAQHG